MRFCNKQCEKDAHTKEKSTKKEPENHTGETEDLLKKQVEAEMKRIEKNKRTVNTIKGNFNLVKELSSGIFSKSEKDKILQIEGLTKPSS